MKHLLIFLWLLGACEAGSLFKKMVWSRDEPECCQGEFVLSCRQFQLDPDALGDDDLYLEPLNTTLQFKGMVGDSDHAYHYGSDHIDFTITLQKQTADAYGHAMLDDGRSLVIEFCGEGIHVLKELNFESLGNHEEVDSVVGDENTTSHGLLKLADTRDISTIVTYTIKVYYTPQFAASTTDVIAFVDQVIQETNLGYINTRVPLRVRALCIEQATVNDINDPRTMLLTFARMKGSISALRGTADAAALLVRSFRACGTGARNSISNGATVSVIHRACALGYYSFGHVLGLNMGLNHNREVSQNANYPDGHGYHFAPGYRTIMAYTDRANRHRTRVNYYSNPTVPFPPTGTPTGVFDVANNARVLTVNRFAMANVGDERDSTCTFSTSCAVQSTWRWMRFDYRGRVSEWGCRRQCSRTAQCVAWNRSYATGYCYLINMRTGKRDSGKFSGPDFTKSVCLQKAGDCTTRGKVLYQSERSAGRQPSKEACHAVCQARGYCHRWNWNGSWCVTWSLKQRSGRYSSGFKYCNP
eukprot:TRINITY_DN6318_c0_g1_i2.p1 TRINITY_DN6318_c0_g1~~TRINITY_DN6318_c0_g1_i2.p1  ORF type:complete len:529 (+),score=57.41 TRINITY_DN6318_c0_g1_i2:44-1630(+)